MTPDRAAIRAAARSDLIRLLAARIVREALAEQQQQSTTEQANDARRDLRPLQQRQPTPHVDR